VILAAASQRTRNIRLGHGIIHMPPTFNHPIRLAERIATLDLVSNGRVEVGTGEGESVKIRGGGRMVGFTCQWHLPRALSIPMQTLKNHNLSLEAVVFTQFPWNLTLSVTN
jgi:hypothetical protein